MRRLRPFEYLEATTVAEAVDLLGQHEGRIKVLAGGTDLLVELRQTFDGPDYLLNVKPIRDLAFVDSTADGLRVGALTTLSALAGSNEVQVRFPTLAAAAGAIGSPQIRGAATLGGRLCQAAPADDLAPVLISLKAEVVLAGPGGERRLPVEKLFAGLGQPALGPAELLTAVVIPWLPAGAATSYLRQSRREAMDVPLAAVATALVIGDGTCRAARLVVGAVGPTPTQATQAERLLIGQAITPDLAARAGDAAASETSTISDLRAAAWYRTELLRVLTRRAILQATDAVGSKQ